MLKIAFRVDANNRIGAGHLMEVAAIIGAMRKNIKFKPIIVTATKKIVRQKLHQDSAIKVVGISDNATEQIDARETTAWLQRLHCTNLVTDLMIRSSAYYRYIAKRVQHLCVIQDDTKHRETHGTAIINFSITQNPKFYAKLGCRYYLGPQYMPMNEKILRYPRRVGIGAVKKIFINQGGGDPFGLTAKTLRALKPLRLKQEIKIVVGGVLKPRHFAELKKMEQTATRNLHYYYNIAHEKVLEMMSESDLALSAPGNALYELAYFKVPTIVISHHSRHDKIAKTFARQKAILNIGVGRKISQKKIRHATSVLLENETKRAALSRNIGRLVDGRGLRRVIDIIIKMIQT